MPNRLYLDYAATTPLLPVARAAMDQAWEVWANPSSPHAEGRAARAVVEDARQRLKAALNWSGEVIFTSGATEAITIALARSNADAIFVSATEHGAVHRAAANAYFVPVLADGRVASAALTGRLAALAAKMPLVALQAVNSETGVQQPLNMLIPIVEAANGVVLADCSQSAGKIALPDAHFIALSAHKLGGPIGVGALLVGDFSMLTATGGQERGYRSGTENLPAIMGFVAALEERSGWLTRAADLRAHLDSAIEAAGGIVVARETPRLPTIASYQMTGVSSNTQLIQFDIAGIAISAGSACSSGSIKPSHVLMAMGWSETAANEVIRVSFGPQTNRADVYRFIETWQRIRG